MLNFTGVSSGVSIIDGKVTVINNINGEIVPPCKDGLIIFPKEDIYQNTKKIISKTITPEEKDCNLEIVDIDPDSKSNFLASLEASKKIINGTVLKDGKKISAMFVVQVTALFKGSTNYCLYVGGNLICIKIKDSVLCKAMGAALLANKNSMSRKEYRIAKSALKGQGCVIS